jgi:hypothetical protein
MNIKKILGWILMLPLILLNIATLGVGIYAALGYVPGFLISWAAPAIIGGFQLAFIIGVILNRKARNETPITTDIEQTSTDEQYDQEQYVSEQQ